MAKLVHEIQGRRERLADAKYIPEQVKMRLYLEIDGIRESLNEAMRLPKGRERKEAAQAIHERLHELDGAIEELIAAHPAPKKGMRGVAWVIPELIKPPGGKALEEPEDADNDAELLSDIPPEEIERWKREFDQDRRS